MATLSTTSSMAKFKKGDLLIQDTTLAEAEVVDVVREKDSQYDRYLLTYLPHAVGQQAFLVRHIEMTWQLKESVVG